MAETATATKHLSSINGGSVLTDTKNLSSLFKTKRLVAFAYGFMFAFVAFTVFLAFCPSPNSYSPWFTNILASAPSTNQNSTSTITSTTDSHGSQFASIFSYFFPTDSSSEPQSPDNGSNTTFSQPPPSSVKNETLSTVPQTNQSLNTSIVNNPPPMDKNLTQIKENSDKVPSLKPNQTLVSVSGNSVNTTTTTDLVPPQKATNNTNSGKDQKGVGVKVNGSNDTASLAKKQGKRGNGSSNSSVGEAGKKGVESLVKELVNCDLFDGEWIKDESYPLYKPGSCSLIDEQFNCILNGRPDKEYHKYKWKPKACSLPRLNPGHMLDMLRGKRLAFVGDSLNRNMWESLVCILKGSVKDESKVYEANGRHHFKGEASYSFVFKDYGCTVEFFVSPFLVREWEMPDKNGLKKETLRLDLLGKSSDQYKGADIIIFNTGHWWTHGKTSLGKDYYQEGSHVYNELNVLEAFRKALTTWARWVDANINPIKSQVFFRGYSASHFSGGQWNSGGACDSEVEPIKNSTYLKEYPPKMMVLEKVMRGMKTHVKYLNITRMTDYRKDGHPSIYRKQSLSEEERRSPLHYQDCSHWCLPGVPDTWNEILYAELLINEYQKQQVQKRHR